MKLSRTPNTIASLIEELSQYAPTDRVAYAFVAYRPRRRKRKEVRK